MSEHSAWVEANPDYEQVHLDVPALGDSVRLGITKPPSDFQKYVIGKAKLVPGSNIKTKFDVPKEY